MKRNVINSDIKIKQKRGKLSIMSSCLLIILIVYSISLFLPFIWGIITSLKDYWDFRSNKFGLPTTWRFDNYILVFENFHVQMRTNEGIFVVSFIEMFGNSLLYAGGCAIMATIAPCTVAYVTSKFPCKISRIIDMVVIITMALPIMGTLPSQIRVAKMLGIYGSMIGIWIMSASWLGLYYLVFAATFKSIPASYYEAAAIDGASNVLIYIKIMLPLIKSTILTVFLLRFIGYWNDYQVAYVFVSNMPTVAYGLFIFNQSKELEIASVPMKLTGSILCLLPILILFLIFQKRLMGNLNMGGLKE